MIYQPIVNRVFGSYQPSYIDLRCGCLIMVDNSRSWLIMVDNGCKEIVVFNHSQPVFMIKHTKQIDHIHVNYDQLSQDQPFQQPLICSIKTNNLNHCWLSLYHLSGSISRYINHYSPWKANAPVCNLDEAFATTKIDHWQRPFETTILVSHDQALSIIIHHYQRPL